MRYWFDADVLIKSNNGHYPIGNALGFWSWMETEIKAGHFKVPKRVYDEIVNGRDGKKDDLAKWMERRKANGLCVMPTKEVDARLTEVANYVWSHPQHPLHQKVEFSKGGDCFLIAHALFDGGTIVSDESNKFPQSARVRIPDVCGHFNVKCRTLVQLIRDLDAKF
jgi:Domain of unknown function (DUF4411)